MNLKEERVRVVLRRSYQGQPLDILRGRVTDQDEIGIKVSGRRYQKIKDEIADKVIEKPVDEETKIIFVPYTSIRTCEIIVEGTREEEIDKRAKLEKPLARGEFKRDSDL